MLKQLVLKERLKRKGLVVGCSLAACGYLFSIETASLGLILFSLTWLLVYKESRFQNFFSLNVSHFLVMFFLLVLFGLVYTIDFDSGMKHALRYLSFLVFPLIFSTIIPLSKRERTHVIKIYTWAVTFLFIICFVNAIYRQIVFSLSGGPFNWYFFYRFDLLEILNQHPTYVSMFTLMSLNFILFGKTKVFRKNWIQCGVSITQIFGILFAGSRIGYALLFLLFLLYGVKKILDISRAKRVKIIIIHLSVLIAMLIIAWNIPIIKERILYSAGVKYNYKFNSNTFIKKDNPIKQGRLLLWEDALEIIELKPMLGHGTGSNMSLLKKKYKEKNHHIFYKREYNTHSTYLGILLSGGILRFLSYMLLLFSILYIGLKRRIIVINLFFIIILTTSITEMIFRAQGVLFFSFFYCFLLLDKNE